MKIVLLVEFYQAYLSDFHTANEQKVAGLDYAGHLEVLLGDYFGFFPSYRNHFRRIGYQAELFVPNYYPLQQKWLAEHGIALSATPETRKQIALNQITEARPDVLFMSSMFDYYGDFLRDASGITPNILTWINCPFPEDLDFGPVKCVLSATGEYRKIFERLGVKSERLLSAFDPDILDVLQKRPKTVPLSFIGGLSSNHRERLQMLEWLIRRDLELQIWGYLTLSRKQKLLRLFRSSPIESRHRGPVWGLAMYQALADSRITLNIHLDFAKHLGAGGNMRTYEALGCGALLLSDFVPEMEEVVRPGRDLVTFSTVEELLEKARYYLDHENEAAKIAAAGQQTCLQKHSCAQRIVEFDGIIRRYCS